MKFNEWQEQENLLLKYKAVKLNQIEKVKRPKKEEEKYRSSPWSSMRKTIILATEMQVCLVLTLLADALHKFCKLFYFCKTLGYLEPSQGIK